MTVRLTPNHFSAASNLHGTGEQSLIHAMRWICQHNAKSVLSSTDGFTDNSGGTSGDEDLPAISDLTPYTTAGTDMASKAGWDTAWGKVRNAVATVAAQLNTITTIVPAITLTDSTGGTDGDGTIAAIGNVGTAVDAAGVSVADANEDLAELRIVFRNLADAVNMVATACGEPVIDNSLIPRTTTFSSTLAELDATTGTAVDGTEDSGVAKTDADAILGEIADVIATLAAKLDDCVDGNAPTVGAVAV